MVWRVRQVVRTTGAFLVVRLAVADVGRLTAFAVETVAVFRTAVAAGAFLAGVAPLVGVVFGPPAHARAPMARMAAKVASFIVGKQCTRKRAKKTGSKVNLFPVTFVRLPSILA